MAQKRIDREIGTWALKDLWEEIGREEESISGMESHVNPEIVMNKLCSQDSEHGGFVWKNWQV